MYTGGREPSECRVQSFRVLDVSTPVPYINQLTEVSSTVVVALAALAARARAMRSL